MIIMNVADMTRSSLPILHSEGLSMYDRAILRYDKNKNSMLQVDFYLVEHTSFAFLNAFIGKLVWDTVPFIVVNASERVQTQVDQVIVNAENTRLNKTI